MKAFFRIWIIAFLLACTLSCDKVETPLKEGFAIELSKKILLEDFTGHTCVNCPKATRVAEQLEELYGDQLIVVAVHASFFAEPENPPSHYTSDYRTEAGEVYLSEFGIPGLPNGLVNRTPFENSVVVGFDDWGDAVSELQNITPKAYLEFEEAVYNSDESTVTTTIQCGITEDLTEDYNMIVYFLEDSILDWQKDIEASPSDVENYLHRHVLRDNLNGTWGSRVVEGGALEGDVFTRSYTYSPDPSWDIEQCSLVAFLYNVNSKEIVQVENAYIEIQ